jgi:diaminopimelate decarboxylase
MAAAEPEADLARTLIREAFAIQGGELAIGGLGVGALAERFGTPLFVYDAGLLRLGLRRLRQALGREVEVYYSVKANPNPAVIEVFVEAGAGLEVASGAEYIRARRAGGRAERILFAGPGKGEDELDYVLQHGIGEIHLESEAEIALVDGLARRHGIRVSVGLRVNPVGSAQGGAMRMGGKPAQFGFDEERLDEAIAAVGRTETLDLCGLHLFAGTQILEVEVLLAQWRHAVELAARVAAVLGRPLATVDLGGGLGIPYFAGDRPLDLAALGVLAPPLFAEAAGRLPGTRFVVEPGRFLAGPAGIYLCRVRAVKDSRGQCFVVVDGGMHHHLAASGNLGQVIKRDYPVVLANRLDQDSAASAAVVGPLCTPLDTIGRKVALPRPAVGDLVAVLQSGAYGLSASPVGFLSQPMPAELLVDAGKARLIRPRGTLDQPITPLP